MITIEEYQEFFENITKKNKLNILETQNNFNKNLLFFTRICKEIQCYPDDLDVILKFYPKEDSTHFWNFFKIIVLDESIAGNVEVFKGLLLVLEILVKVADDKYIFQLLKIISQKQNIKKLCDENVNLFLEFFIKQFEYLLHSKEDVEETSLA